LTLPILLALPWLALLAAVVLLVRRRPVLEDWPPVRSGEAPLVSLIIPARNEADNLGPCLEDALASAYPRLEVLVVDDASEDGTGDIAQRNAERDGRVRVITGEGPPPGWFGKPAACARGAAEARGEILAFLDADVRQHPEALGRAVSAMRDRGADLLTLLPRQVLASFWERLIMPQITTLILFRYADPERVNRSPRTRDKLGVGQFLMLTREAYDGVGGHGRVRHEVAEDLRLAQAVHAGGGNVVLMIADRFLSVRMYTSLGGIVEGWSKNVAIASRQTVPGWLAPVVPWSLVLWLLLVWVMPAAALLGWLAGALPVAWGAWGALASGVGVLFWAGVFREMRIPLRYVLLYPLGAAVAAGILARSAARGERRIEWKGRRYGEMAAPSGVAAEADPAP
jgi:chlorobactene glucosyltransferase